MPTIIPIASDDDRAPACKTLEEAANRFMIDERGSGINGEDFLKLCDHYSLIVTPTQRQHFQNHVLQINLRRVTTFDNKSNFSPYDLMESLSKRILGIVPEEQLKLRVQMIPKALHGRNLRLALGRSRWSALRESILSKSPHVCDTCHATVDSSSDLHAHEEWEYDLKKRPNRANLARIGLICRQCHGVEHFGDSIALYKEGHLPLSALEDLVAHFCEVNQVGEAMWNFHLEQAFDRWERISRRKSWTITLGEYSYLLSAEELAAL